LNEGTSQWWFGVTVSGGGETLVKVEMKDSGSTDWSALVDFSYAYVFDKHVQLVLPISLRLTSSSGKQVTLSNVFTSFSSNLVSTGQTFTSGSSTAPAPTNTNAPSTSAPATPPPATSTNRPTAPPASGSSPVKVTVHSGTNSWWFAVTVSGNTGAISTVELMDSGSVRSFVPLSNNGWGYSYTAQGSQLVAPITVRVTSGSKQVTSTIASLTPSLVSTANGSL